MMRPLFSLLVLLSLMGSAHATDRIWAGLFLAENHPTGPQAPPHLTEQLHQVFGFTNYRLVKGENIDLRSHWSHWVLARKDFFLRIDPLPHTSGEPDRLAYEIYKDGFIIAKGHYIPAPGTPLFINGPDFRHGRLVFVVEAR